MAFHPVETTTYTPLTSGPFTKVSLKDANQRGNRHDDPPVTRLTAHYYRPQQPVTTSKYDAPWTPDGPLAPRTRDHRDRKQDLRLHLRLGFHPHQGHSNELRNNGSTTGATQYYDGLLRAVQLDAVPADSSTGTRVTSGTRYDNLGRANATFGPLRPSGAPGSGLIDFEAVNTSLPTRTDVTFDTSGRTLTRPFVTVSAFPTGAVDHHQPMTRPHHPASHRLEAPPLHRAQTREETSSNCGSTPPQPARLRVPGNHVHLPRRRPAHLLRGPGAQRMDPHL